MASAFWDDKFWANGFWDDAFWGVSAEFVGLDLGKILPVRPATGERVEWAGEQRASSVMGKRETVESTKRSDQKDSVRSVAIDQSRIAHCIGVRILFIASNRPARQG